LIVSQTVLFANCTAPVRFAAVQGFDATRVDLVLS